MPSVDVWLDDMITKCHSQSSSGDGISQQMSREEAAAAQRNSCNTRITFHIFIAKRRESFTASAAFISSRVYTTLSRAFYSQENLICSLINRWSVFLFGFFILLPSISFSLFVFRIRDFVAQFTERLFVCSEKKLHFAISTLFHSSIIVNWVS